MQIPGFFPHFPGYFAFKPMAKSMGVSSGDLKKVVSGACIVLEERSYATIPLMRRKDTKIDGGVSGPSSVCRLFRFHTHGPQQIERMLIAVGTTFQRLQVTILRHSRIPNLHFKTCGFKYFRQRINRPQGFLFIEGQDGPHFIGRNKRVRILAFHVLAECRSNSPRQRKHIPECKPQNAAGFQRTKCLKKEAAGFFRAYPVNDMFQIISIHRFTFPRQRTGYIIIGSIQIQPAV